jgi:hypothetical protein
LVADALRDFCPPDREERWQETAEEYYGRDAREMQRTILMLLSELPQTNCAAKDEKGANVVTFTRPAREPKRAARHMHRYRQGLSPVTSPKIMSTYVNERKSAVDSIMNRRETKMYSGLTAKSDKTARI